MISIVLATLDKLDYLKLFVSSVQKNTKVPYEILIWDNGSTDGTKEWCETINCKYYRSEENLCITKPYNKMIKDCKYDLFFQAENDFYMMPNWDKAADEVKEVGDVRFVTLLRPSHNTYRPLGLPAFYGESVKNFQEEKLLQDYLDKKSAVRYYGGWGPVIMNKHEFFELGGYNENFLGNEREMNWKVYTHAKKHGKKLLTHPESFCYHFLEKTQPPRAMHDEWRSRDAYFESTYNISMGDSEKELKFMEVAGPAYDENGELIKYD